MILLILFENKIALILACMIVLATLHINKNWYKITDPAAKASHLNEFLGSSLGNEILLPLILIHIFVQFSQLT